MIYSFKKSFILLTFIISYFGFGSGKVEADLPIGIEQTSAPVNTLYGDENVEINQGTTSTDVSATATDNLDGNITANITATGIVDTNTPGAHTITYTVTDSQNNHGKSSRTVNVLDTEAPIITLLGASNFSINNDEIYTDPGFTVTDNIDNNLEANVTISGTVDTSIPGTYTLTYDVTDTAGNPAIQKTRIVTVVDTVAPTITLLGDNPLLINQGGTYTEPGATAVDHPGISYTGSIVIAGSVNVNVAGTYFITYNVNDSAGNSATQKVRIVNVLDTEAPVITLAGTSPVSVNQGATYTDAGATAIDNVDGNITANITATSTVDTSIVGSYTVSYNVADAAGNNASVLVRIVNVLDTESPVITLVGTSPVSVNQGATYTDAGATARDNFDGNISANITATSTVDTSAAGTYTVTYTVSDAAGNTATPVVRTVNVTDTEAPVVTRNGLATVSILSLIHI